MAKFFIYPFAYLGDKTAIPDAPQPDGSVSYTMGFTSDYQLIYGTDPNAKAVPRFGFNELMYDVTNAVRQYQTEGFPDFIPSADNGGTPYPYDIYAIVRYDDGGGMQLYISTAGSNTATPPTSPWKVLSTSNQALTASVSFETGHSQLITTTPGIVSFNFQDTNFNSTSAWWDASNYSMKPTIAGYFDVSISVVIEFAGTFPNSDYMVMEIHKNGSIYRTLDKGYVGSILNSAGEQDNSVYFSGNLEVIANGSTDYFQVIMYLTVGTTRVIGNAGDRTNNGQFQMTFKGTT